MISEVSENPFSFSRLKVLIAQLCKPFSAYLYPLKPGSVRRTFFGASDRTMARMSSLAPFPANTFSNPIPSYPAINFLKLSCLISGYEPALLIPLLMASFISSGTFIGLRLTEKSISILFL